MCRNFTIRGPQVKADATPIQVAAQRLAKLSFGRNFYRVTGEHRERFLVNTLSHKVVVKLALSTGRLAALEVIPDTPGTTHVYPPATTKFQQLFPTITTINQNTTSHHPVYR